MNDRRRSTKRIAELGPEWDQGDHELDETYIRRLRREILRLSQQSGPAEREAVLEEAARHFDKCAAKTGDKLWESAAEQVRALKRHSATDSGA